MASIFAGSDKGHGTHAEPTQQPGSLKWEIKTTARTIREGPTVEHWLAHLNGERPLGVIPIREDGMCKWGSIDVDQYDGNVLDIVARADRSGLPLVPCRSKSGGLHLYAFFAEWTPAAVVMPALKHIAATLGLSKDVEIFPKQTQLASRDDLGNWILAPYFSGNYGGKLRQQVGLKKTGAEMDLGEFIAAADKARIVKEQLMALRDTRSRGALTLTEGAPFSDGPPCLQHLVAAGLLGDGRKRALFHMGVYYKRAQPDGWRKALEEANMKHMTPPLDSAEVAGVVRSLSRRDYNYKCKEEPMVSHCDSLTCRARKHGVGDGAVIPVISGMSVLNVDPPLWFVDVEDQRIEMTTEELQQYHLFHFICMKKLHRTFVTLNRADWFAILGAAMKNVEIVDAPEELGEVGQFLELLREFLTNRATAERFEDLLSGRPWFDEDNTKKEANGPGYFFVLAVLMSFIDRERAPKSMTRRWVAQRVRDLKGRPRQFNNIKNTSLNTFYVPASSIVPLPTLELPQERTAPI
jgi:hypothetical protein